MSMKTEAQANGEAYYGERMQRAGVPEHLRDGLINYLVYHIEPGGFLWAVLEHELFDAIGRADDTSRAGLDNLVSFLCNDAPADAHGSYGHVSAWLARER